MSKVLLQKIIEEILIKKLLLQVKGTFIEYYRRNLAQKVSFTLEEILIKKALLLVNMQNRVRVTQ